MGQQLGRQQLRDAHDRLLHESVEERSSALIGDAHDETSLPIEHQGQGRLSGNEMGVHSTLHGAKSILQRKFPERLPFIEVVAVDVVDQNVQAAFLRRDTLKKSTNL